MYISELIISNYKSIKNEKFIFRKGINILVGKNNAGKSNIVSALNEILGEKYSNSAYEDKIFYIDKDNRSEKKFKIIAKIQDITNLDFTLIKNIKKSIGCIDITDFFHEKEKDFENEWLIEDDNELKDKYPEKFNFRGTNLLKWWKNEELETNLRTTETIWIYKYVNKEEESNVYNIIIKLNQRYYRLLYVNSNIKATLITSLLIPAFRTPETTLKINKWSWYGKLLQKKWNESCGKQESEDIDRASQILKETIEKVYIDLKLDMNAQLKSTLTLMNINIDINMLEAKSEDYYKSIKLWVNDGVQTPLENKGSGLQNLIMIELFKYYCKVFNSSSLLILEEPELYLHPHAKRMLADILNNFISVNENQENQIILTTHSEEFIKNVNIENINVIRNGEDGTKKSSIRKENYKSDKELQKLKIELQYKNAEMFFAEKVILVEGEEQIILPSIIKSIYKKNVLNNNDISVIKVGGKSYFEIYKKVLDELNIKNYIIADYDILDNGINKLISDELKEELNTIKTQIPTKIKSNKNIAKKQESRDWSVIVDVIDKMIEEKKYNSDIDDKWSLFKDKIFERVKLKDLESSLKIQIEEYIEKLYGLNIFIMKNGELEDYYKKENFGEEFKGINGKGIIAYKVAEMAQEKEIEKFMILDEYKEIIKKILEI